MTLICANVQRDPSGGISRCQLPAPNFCNGCSLVQYCGKDCQRAHWDCHKKDCKSPLLKSTWKPQYDAEGHVPAFVSASGPPITTFGVQKYLWGNLPAIDVLNLKDNEGSSCDRNLNLLFAASGDIRNLLMTLVKFPTPYQSACEIVINDRDLDIVARNAILLLTALSFEPEVATRFMLHIWYSALVPAHIVEALQSTIKPLVEDICTKIKNKPATALLSKVWTFGSRSLRLVLTKESWDRLLTYFKVPDGLTVSRANAIRIATTMAPSRKDYVDRALYNKPPAWRLAMMKFRERGILLPFGCPQDESDTPNPTFFQNLNSWPMLDSSDPLSGWRLEDVKGKAAPARGDIYGALFYYLQDIIGKFCGRVSNMQIKFTLYQLDALDLPGTLSTCGRQQFDRIELSNIVDRGYSGLPACLRAFGPLLKDMDQNPHATLLAVFMNAVHEGLSGLDVAQSTRQNMQRVMPYLPVTPDLIRRGNQYSADFFRLKEASAIFWDFDRAFDRYMTSCHFEDVAKAANLKMKTKNTIIAKWPLRLRENATQEEFDLLNASGHTGGDRYVEWKKIAEN